MRYTGLQKRLRKLDFIFVISSYYLIFVSPTAIKPASKIKVMTTLPTDALKHIEFYVNHNTEECSASFGLPFTFDGCLMNLPAIKDDKLVHVLGLTPYTVERTINIPYYHRHTASYICSSYHNDAAGMMDHLTRLVN